MTHRRPPTITAAAVLLIVVGSQLAIGAVAVLVWIGLDVVATKQPQLPVLTSGCVLVLLLSRDLLRSGVRLVRGTFETSWEVTDRYLLHRAFAVVGTLASVVWCVLDLTTSGLDHSLNRLQTTAGAVLAAVVLSVWLNTAAFLTACSLCAKHADAYTRWRADAEHPPEEAAP